MIIYVSLIFNGNVVTKAQPHVYTILTLSPSHAAISSKSCSTCIYYKRKNKHFINIFVLLNVVGWCY